MREKLPPFYKVRHRQHKKVAEMEELLTGRARIDSEGELTAKQGWATC